MSTPVHPVFDGLTPKSQDFLVALSEHNEREWFKSNKADYDRLLKAPFESFITALSVRLEDTQLNLRGGKQSVFRLYRDIRFSKDKTPFKTHVGGVLSYSGKKKDPRGIVYIQFAADGGFMAAGFYQPSNDVLGAIREQIISDPKAAIALFESYKKQALPIQAPDSLKRMPRGFESHKDADIASLLKMKGFIIKQPLSPAQWYEPSIVDTATEFVHQSHALINFGREAIALMPELAT